MFLLECNNIFMKKLENHVLDGKLLNHVSARSSSSNYVFGEKFWNLFLLRTTFLMESYGIIYDFVDNIEIINLTKFF